MRGREKKKGIPRINLMICTDIHKWTKKSTSQLDTIDDFIDDGSSFSQ